VLCLLTSAAIFFLSWGLAADSSQPVQAVDGHICQPQGKGPFPVVVYIPGSTMDNEGPKKMADLLSKGEHPSVKICQALAAEGFLTFIPIRHTPETGPRRTKGAYDWMSGKEEVARAVDYVKSLPAADSSRIALLGFSRGGFLSLMLATERTDLKALVLMAPAAPGRAFDNVVRDLSAVNAPVLLLIEAEDHGHMRGAETLHATLRSLGKDLKFIRYDRGGGHYLFTDIGYYWDDVRAFLREKLAR